MVVGDWGLPPQDTRRRAVKSSTGMRGLPTIRVIIVEAKLLTDTHSRSAEGTKGIQSTNGFIGATWGPCMIADRSVLTVHAATLITLIRKQVLITVTSAW